MISTTDNSALSPGQPPQPSLSGGQEGAKNPPALYPGDTTMTNQTCLTANGLTFSNTVENSTRENLPSSQNYETLEPYNASGEWTTVSRQKSKQRRRNERRIRQLIDFETNFEEKPYFVNVFNVKFPGIDISKELNLVKANKEIDSKLGKLKRITKAGRNTLIIETENEVQANKLKALKEIANVHIVVEPHKSYNQVKGIIKSKAFGMSTSEELLECLSEQGVDKIQRVSIKRNNQEIVTDTYIVWFNKHELPKVVKVTDWHYEVVEEYKQRPQQCFNCQRYGHVAKYCRRIEKTCVRCGVEGHTRQECGNEVSCFHCRSDHYANDKECDRYKVEEEIVVTQHKERISKQEATQRVMSKMPQEKLYSAGVRGPKQSQERDRIIPTKESHSDNKKGTERPIESINIPKESRSTENKSNVEKRQAKQDQSKIDHPEIVTTIDISIPKTQTSTKGVKERMKKNAAEYVAKKLENQNNDTEIRQSTTTVAATSEKQTGKRSKNDDHKDSRKTHIKLTLKT